MTNKFQAKVYDKTMRRLAIANL